MTISDFLTEIAMRTKRKTKKRERMIYRFSLDKERYGEIIRLLDSLPKPFRGEYIAESIRIARLHLGLEGGPSSEPPPELRGAFTL